MKKARYKLVENVGLPDEKTKYFGMLTYKQTEELKRLDNYVLLWYSSRIGYYLTYDIKITNSQREYYDANIKTYREEI